MNYDKYFDNLGLNSKPPQFESTVNVDPGQTTSGFLASGGIRPDTRGSSFANAAEARAATSAFIVDQLLPYSLQWNFGIQHVLASDYTFEIRYLGTRGVHLPTQHRFNVGKAVTPTRFIPTYLNRPDTSTLASLPTSLGDLLAIDFILPEYQPYFDDAFIVGFPYRGNSTYHGLATEFTRRMSKGLLFKTAYTWSHLIDDSTADLFSTLLAPRRPEDFQDMRAERSSSFLDRRHRFTFNWIYDTPWFSSSSNRLARYALANFVIAGTYTYESPQYATVQSNVDSNLNGDSAGDRAILNLNGVEGTGSGVTGVDRNGTPLAAGSAGIVAYIANNPNAQYIVAGLGARTNVGRMTMATSPINNFDFQVKKQFAITESKRLQVSAQFFNAFNHPQFIPGYLNYVQFHNSNTTRNNLVPGNAIFNRPDLAYDSNARSIQLTARFQF